MLERRRTERTPISKTFLYDDGISLASCNLLLAMLFILAQKVMGLLLLFSFSRCSCRTRSRCPSPDFI